MITVIYNQTGTTLFKSKSYFHNTLLKEEYFELFNYMYK